MLRAGTQVGYTEPQQLLLSQKPLCAIPYAASARVGTGRAQPQNTVESIRTSHQLPDQHLLGLPLDSGFQT